MNFFSLDTEEGSEFYIKKTLLSFFKDISVYIPIEKKNIRHNSKDYDVFEKRIEGYVLFKKDCLSLKDIKKIKTIDGVHNIVWDYSGDVPAEISEEDAKVFIGDDGFDVSYLVGKKILLIEGTYSGYNGEVIKINKNNDVTIRVSIKNNPTVDVPLWYIAIEV